MAKIRNRTDNGLLFFDFRYKGLRFREQTLLPDTPANRARLEKILDRIESEIAANTFDYTAFFPESRALDRLALKVHATSVRTSLAHSLIAITPDFTAPLEEVPQIPTFEDFANQWFEEKKVEWRRSHIKSLRSTLDSRIIPVFGPKVVSSITKSDILAFRAALAKEPGRGGKDGLSPKRINEITGESTRVL